MIVDTIQTEELIPLIGGILSWFDSDLGRMQVTRERRRTFATFRVIRKIVCVDSTGGGTRVEEKVESDVTEERIVGEESFLPQWYTFLSGTSVTVGTGGVSYTPPGSVPVSIPWKQPEPFTNPLGSINPQEERLRGNDDKPTGGQAIEPRSVLEVRIGLDHGLPAGLAESLRSKYPHGLVDNEAMWNVNDFAVSVVLSRSEATALMQELYSTGAVGAGDYAFWNAVLKENRDSDFIVYIAPSGPDTWRR